jgi:hypothetical protein
MTPPRASEIDEALRGFLDASPEELRVFTEQAGKSSHFVADVVSALRMISDGNCLTETMWASMIVMLWAGMAIERNRQEVDLLERIYGGDAA